jgi:hypothetical protein
MRKKDDKEGGKIKRREKTKRRKERKKERAMWIQIRRKVEEDESGKRRNRKSE